MANKDDVLQEYIAMLEAGMPLEEIMTRLPDGDADLRNLLMLAASIRAVPRPQPGLAGSRNGVVHSLIQERVYPPKRSLLPDLRRWWVVPRLALSGIGALALILIIVFWVVSLSTISGRAAALTVAAADGQVEVSSDAAGWQPLTVGDSLTAGQQLRTGPDSSAVLSFFEGSRLHLAANSELVITALAQRQGEALAVELTQRAGSTRHEVVALHSSEAAYVVHTPFGDAQVQGTTFSVAVAADGRAYLSVDEGEVRVTAGGTTVAVAAGHATGIAAGQAPAAPVRHFRSQGQLLRQNGNAWQINELLVYVTEESILTDTFTAGDFVLVSGRILPNGRWQADSVELAPDTGRYGVFAGLVQSMTPELWLVGDMGVVVTDETLRPADLAEGDLVRVIYTNLSDGRRLAQRIEPLARAAANTPAAEETEVNVAQPARPSLSFEPDEVEAAGCQRQYTLPGVLENSGELPQDAAAGVELGYDLLAGADFIENVAITPSRWQSIAAGEGAAFTVRVRLNEAWLEAPPEAEVKLRLFVAAEANRPGHHLTRLTVTLVHSCQPAATPSATLRPPGLASPTPTARPGSATATPVPAGDECTAVSPHPEGTRLAQIYSVSYAEIMAWFCSGFGFGEIDVAYSLSRQTGAPVADIFAMRRDGLGWGEIMQALGIVPGGGPPTGVPANPGADPTEEASGPPPWVTPGNPSGTPDPTGEAGSGPPVVPPGPSMTPPTPPGPPANPGPP